MKEQEETKFKAGQTVFAKVDPTVKLIIRRYYQQIYYCQFAEDLKKKELALFEREIQE